MADKSVYTMPPRGPGNNTELPEYIDVLIIGAGLSGVSAAWHLQTHCPNKTYAIVEARNAMGGTWDLFRYPGIRSDSDMYTLGFSFKPWKNPKAIADGPSILEYIKETAAEYGIDEKIHFNHKVKTASWSSEDALWTVQIEGQNSSKVTCRYIYLCTGYYNYDEGYMPGWPGMDTFQGQTVHPQFWPEDMDYTNKKVIVIGSGATAVTIVPSMAEKAAHVTMLQRSPTYVVSRPSQDAIANWANKWLPSNMAYALARMKNIRLSAYFYNLTRRKPEGVKLEILRLIREELGPDYDVERHFFPRYNPWDQRVCLVPDGDLFEAIRQEKVEVVTDTIETFTKNGLRLNSGRTLDADIIVTATGLKLQASGGVQMICDGKEIDWGERLIYKGMMFNDIPNTTFAFGYTNASWTLKCDMSAEYFCRLLNYMDEHNYTTCTPRQNDPNVTIEAGLNLTSGYIQRAYDTTPKQGSKAPWKLHQNYFKDKKEFRNSPLDDGVMEFKSTPINKNVITAEFKRAAI